MQNLTVGNLLTINSSIDIGWEMISKSCGSSPCIVSCSSGKKALTGGCGGYRVNVNIPLNETVWKCTDSYSTISAYVVCARVE